MKKKNIEQKVADTILERSEEIVLAGKTYLVAPPTIATLIQVSELISLLPDVHLETKNLALESLAVAKDCKALGEIIAVLILGQGIPPQTKTIRREGFPGWFGLKAKVVVDPYKELGKEVLSCSPSQIEKLLITLLTKMEIGNFFALSTSLIEVNLLRATREVED